MYALKDSKTRWIVLICVLLIAAIFTCTGAYGEEDDAPNVSYEGRWVPIYDDYKIYLPNDWVDEPDPDPSFYYEAVNNNGFGFLLMVRGYTTGSNPDATHIKGDMDKGVDFRCKYSDKVAYGKNILFTFYTDVDEVDYEFRWAQGYLQYDDEGKSCFYAVMICTLGGKRTIPLQKKYFPPSRLSIRTRPFMYSCKREARVQASYCCRSA